jgi:hypothetical protein
MRTYRQMNLLPPGGFHFFTVPETETYFEDRQLDRLVRTVGEHYTANGLPVPEKLRDTIMDYVCQNVPESFCKGDPVPGGKQRRFVTLAQLRDFTRVAAGVGVNAVRQIPEASFVSLDEAEERAKICAECPFNSQGTCTSCNGLKAFVKRLLGTQPETTRDKVLGTCDQCGCLLQVKVHISKDILQRTGSYNYPAACWMRQVSERTPQ